MEYVAIVIVMILAFGLCFLADKGFVKLFRNKSQHKSGKAVRQVKRYGSFGVILFVVGIASLFLGAENGMLFYVAGGVLILTGIAMVVYYLTFGIYYDDETFLIEKFGKKGRVYRYEDICSQKRYAAGMNIMVELCMSDGQTLQLLQKMDGFREFLDTAYRIWLEQTGTDPETCDFHDPASFLWFPETPEE